MNERIRIDPRICHGQACVSGTRIPVHQVVHMLAEGDTIEDLLQEYPSLRRQDVLACLDYDVVRSRWRSTLNRPSNTAR